MQSPQLRLLPELIQPIFLSPRIQLQVFRHRQISGSTLLPTEVNPSSLGFDDETSFVANPALNGATVVSNGDGTFDVRFITDNTTLPVLIN